MKIPGFFVKYPVWSVPVLIALIVVNYLCFNNPVHVTAKAVPALEPVVGSVLENIHLHGWNPRAKTNGSITGGLYINWKMNEPTETNKRNKPGSHDPQVDLYYLNALVEYQSLHPQDHTFEKDVQKLQSLVVFEFKNYNLPKGWIYFYLLRDGLFLHNTSLIKEARTAAYNYYSNWYDAKLGLVYNHTHNPGNYNVEHTITCGVALLEAGKRWNQPAWTRAGSSTIAHTLAVALDPRYHLFYTKMTVLPNGRQEIEDPIAKANVQGKVAEALVNAYNVSHQRSYLNAAGQLLKTLFDGNLWDQVHGGLFFAIDMPNNELEHAYKETRAQAAGLLALHRYNQAMKEMGWSLLMLGKEQRLVTVLTEDCYQAQYHGYFYRMTPDFHIFVSNPRKGMGVEDYFTTEAMGTALDALQQTELPIIKF